MKRKMCPSIDEADLNGSLLMLDSAFKIQV